MALEYFILKKDKKEFVELGKGSFLEEVFELLEKDKRNKVSKKEFVREAMEIFREQWLGKTFLTWLKNTFLPILFDWFDEDCVFLSDFGFETFLNKKTSDEIEKSFSQFKCVFSIFPDENDENSLSCLTYDFSLALSGLKKGKTAINVLTGNSFCLRAGKLYKNEVEVKEISVKDIFSKDWILK